MSSTQGIQNVELPEALKNATALAQDRLTLLSSEEDRLKKLKVSLEKEIASLDGTKTVKQADVDALVAEIAEKEATKSASEEAAREAEQGEGTKKTELAATKKLCEEADKKLEELNAKCQVAADQFTKAFVEKEAVDKYIQDKKQKLEIFTQSVTNLL